MRMQAPLPYEHKGLITVDANEFSSSDEEGDEDDHF